MKRTLVHQFAVIAQRKPAPTPQRQGKQRQGRGSDGPWRRVSRASRRAPGLAAAKEAQRRQELLPRGFRQEEPRGSGSSCPLDLSWPDAMQRELFGCRTPEDRLAWACRWAHQLSGRAAEEKIEARRPLLSHGKPPPPARPVV